MYGFRDQRKPIPWTRFSAVRQGSSRYSTPTLHSIEHTFVPVAPGIARLTFPLPTPPRHVHCYLLETRDGLVLVDTGLGLPDLAERWQELLTGLGRPIASIVITHFHPDHVGGAADAAEATGAD